MRIKSGAQIRNNIFDLFAFKESGTENLIRNAKIHEGFFKNARLKVSAVEYCDLVRRDPVFDKFLRLACDESPFPHFIQSTMKTDFISLRFVGEKNFLSSAFIFLNV